MTNWQRNRPTRSALISKTRLVWWIFQLVLGAMLMLYLLNSRARASDLDQIFPEGSVHFFGDGCPPEFTSSLVSPDGSALSILMQRFSLDFSEMTSGPIERECRFRFRSRTKDQRQWSVARFDLRGFSKLEDGVVALSVLKIQLGRNWDSDRETSRIRGPFEGLFYLSAALTPSDALWSECGRRVTDLFGRIRILLRPKKSREPLVRGNSRIEIDSLDGEWSGKLTFAWKSCL